MSTRIRSSLDNGLVFRLVGLLVGCLSLHAVQAGGQQKPDEPPGNPTVAHVLAGGPTPRWTVSALRPAADAIPVATTDTLLVVSYNGLTVLDRTDGRTLWQAIGLHSDKSVDKLRTIDANDVAFVGMTTTPQQPPVIVLLTSQYHHKHTETDYKVLKDEWQAELEGRELRTGRQLWHTALPLDPQSQASDLGDHLIWYPLDIYGETIVLLRKNTSSDVLFRDARTGAVLDPTHSQDLAVLRASAALHDGRHIHWDTLRSGWPIRLDPVGHTPIALARLELGGSGKLLGRVGDRLIWFVVTDDGMTGHSVFPNYIVCCDASGKKFWQFPKQIADTTDLNALLNNRRLLGYGVMDPQSRVVLVQDRGGWVYALNVNTGKPIGPPLSKRPDNRVWNFRPYGRGYIDYDRDAGLLRYLDGRDGKPIKTIPLRLGKYSQLLYAGSDFVFVDEFGKQSQLVCYASQALLGL